MTAPDESDQRAKIPDPRQAGTETEPLSQPGGDGQVAASTRSPDAAGDEWSVIGASLRDLLVRLTTFAITVGALAIDFAFLAAGRWLQVTANGIFEKIGTLDGTSRSFAATLEIVFNVALFAVILSYVAHDVFVSIRRHWRGGRP